MIIKYTIKACSLPTKSHKVISKLKYFHIYNSLVDNVVKEGMDGFFKNRIKDMP